MSRLFIAEKPSLAQAVWSVLPGTPQRHGVATRVGSDWFVPLAGHILGQAMPDAYLPEDVPLTKGGQKQWRKEDLPIVPGTWILEPRANGETPDDRERDRKSNEAKLSRIASLLKEVETVVHLGDPDEEGQLLVDEVLDYLGNTRPVLRLLVNDYNANKVREALAQLRRNDEPVFRGWYRWALTRSRYDWLFGLNLTRAATLRARELGYDGVLPVGRVQTATLCLVVARDRQIESFKPVSYFSIVADFEHFNGAFRARWRPRDDQSGLDEAGRLTDAQQTQDLLARVQRAQAEIVLYDTREASEPPPLPLSLNELTVLACKQFQCTAQEVLDAAQALYEKHKITSYPRTEVRYLSEAQLDAAPRVLRALAHNAPELEPLLACADVSAPDSHAFDDEKMAGAEHHAIVPTETRADLSALTAIERGVFDLIARSYLAQFFPDAVFLQTKVALMCAGESFVASGKTRTTAGWQDVYAVPEADAVEGEGPATEGDAGVQLLPRMAAGDAAVCQRCDAAWRETKPPARFDEASLIDAMIDLHRYTSDPAAKKRLKAGKGIGTSATRAGIIKELRSPRRGLLALCPGSKTRLCSTPSGRALIDALPAVVSDPTTAGQFQIALDAIAAGGMTYDEFMAHSVQFVTRLVSDLRTAAMALPTSRVPCPKCGAGQLRLRRSDKGAFWGCTNWQSDPACDARYADANGKPVMQAARRGKSRGFGFKRAG